MLSLLFLHTGIYAIILIVVPVYTMSFSTCFYTLLGCSLSTSMKVLFHFEFPSVL